MGVGINVSPEFELTKKTFEKKLVHLDFYADAKVFKYHNTEKVIFEHFAYELDAYIYKRTRDNIAVTYEFEQPSFLDWIFRRKRKFTVNLKVSDIIKNPPPDVKENYIEIYEVELKNK